MNYAFSVYKSIINNDIFIDNVVNEHPYFFTGIIEEFNFKSLDNQYLVHKYLQILFSNRNYHLKREIIEVVSHSGEMGYYISEQNKIINTFLNDIKVAEKNDIQIPIGNAGLLDLKENDNLYKLLFQDYEEHKESELWNYTFYLSLNFFNILIRATATQKIETHFWVHIHSRFFEIILKKLPANYNYDDETETPDIVHYILRLIIENHLEWIIVYYNNNSNQLLQNICDSLGDCLYRLAKTNRLKTNSILGIFNKVIFYYYMLSQRENPGYYLEKLEKLLITPITSYLIDSRVYLKYKKYLNAAWDDFDKIKFRDDYRNRFERNVIDIIRN